MFLFCSTSAGPKFTAVPDHDLALPMLLRFLTSNHNAWTLADRRERLKNMATLLIMGGAFLCGLTYLIAVLGDLL